MTQTHDTIPVPQVSAGRKDSELGPIPQEWEESYIGEFGGLLPGYAFKSDDFGDIGIPIVKIKNISETGNVDLENTDKVQDHVLNEKTSKFLLINGDFIVAMTGATIGKVGKIKSNGEKILLNQRVGKFEIKDKSKLEKNFLYYNTQNKPFSDIINNIANGVAQANISGVQIESIPIPLPPLPEQQAIASILGSLDDKIEVLREQNRTLEKMGQTMFYEWFGKYNIEDELPEGWRVGKLGEVIENFDSKRVPLANMERSKKQGIYPYYGATSIMDYVDDYIFDGIYVLMGEDGSVMNSEGKPFTQYVWGKIRVNNHAHVLQGKNGFSTEMIKIILDAVDIAPYVNGAVQPKINQGNMNSIPVIIPNSTILTEFNELIQPIFEQIRGNTDQALGFIQTCDNLLPRLMSGKVRVGNI